MKISRHNYIVQLYQPCQFKNSHKQHHRHFCYVLRKWKPHSHKSFKLRVWQHFPLRLIGTPYTQMPTWLPNSPRLKSPQLHHSTLATVPVQISRTHHRHFLFSIVNSLPFSRHVALRVIRTLGVQQRQDKAIPLPAVSFHAHIQLHHQEICAYERGVLWNLDLHGPATRSPPTQADGGPKCTHNAHHKPNPHPCNPNSQRLETAFAIQVVKAGARNSHYD